MAIAYQVTDQLEVKCWEDKCNIQVGTYRIAWWSAIQLCKATNI